MAESVEGIAANVRINARTLGLIEERTGLRFWGGHIPESMSRLMMSQAAAAQAAFAAGAAPNETEAQFLERVTPDECEQLAAAVLDGVAKFQPSRTRPAFVAAVADLRKRIAAAFEAAQPKG
ncbi:MAG: hypothetical protein IT450_17930 [Phycisphaerales bacterium]|nr:hypothetical protein [Phycisphaerales bacterium]